MKKRSDRKYSIRARKRIRKKNEDSLRDLWDIRHNNIRFIGGQKEERVSKLGLRTQLRK